MLPAFAGVFFMYKINNLYFGWLHRRFPWMLRPRTSLLIFAMCFACIAIVLLLILLELPKLTGARAD